jgi:hypothetical protein
LEDEQLYPDWLSKKLIEDDLPWGDKSSLSIESFFEKFTLHDSYWVGVFHHLGFDQSVTLAFEWDAVWLPDEIKRNSSLVEEWPYLFFQINGVKEISTANYNDLGSVNRAIAGGEVLNIDGNNHLAIDDVYGGQVNLVYNGELTIMALNPDGSSLAI